MKPLYRLRYDDMCCMHEVENHTAERLGNSIQKRYLRFLDCQANLRAEIIVEQDLEFAVTKYTAHFYNDSDRAVRIYQFDAGFCVNANTLTLHYFTSDWGSEFSPQEKQIENEFSFGSLSGRSCKGFEPWAGLVTPERTYSIALAWSGSWNCTITPDQGNFKFSMGFSYPEFFIDVSPGGHLASASIYVASGESLEDACLELRRYFRARLSLLNDGGIADVPLEYNGWWPYEDKHITEETYLENARIAKEIGCRYAVLDVGWFGESKDGWGWYDKRGDWAIVNQNGFPSGIKALCDNAKKIGILPGIWCEIEAVGKHANLNHTHPHIIAKRDGKPLGYVCLGSEEGRKWAMSVIERILGEYGAKWIKFDFNLDPAPGCNDPSHGHGPGDGLYAHYMGYYRLLKEVHRKYPDVVIENCSSGGLRMDIEMMSHAHWTHLSDPDYTEFHLQCFWGALSYLHQSACLHFSWSEVLGDHNLGIRNPIAEDMERYKFDYYIRAVLMGVPGFSYRLPQMPKWCLERLKELCDFYAAIYKDFILNGDAHRLTGQPVMGGKGERFPVFQFTSRAGDVLMFAFRLNEARQEQVVYPRGLEQDAIYDVLYLDRGESFTASGGELQTNGLAFRGMPEESSEVVRLNKRRL